MLALAHDVQNRINTRRIFEVETVLASYQKESVQRRLEGKLRSASGSRNVENIGLKADVANPIALFDLLDEFEVLDPQWQRDVLDWRELLTDTQETEEGCRNIRTFFSEDIIAQTEYEQMMVYYLYTYFCGAVYDGEALAKVKTAVFSHTDLGVELLC